MFDAELLKLLWDNTLITIYITVGTTIASYLIGVPLGVALVLTARGGLTPVPAFNWLVGGVVNILRTIPFLILLIAVSPLTRLVMGTTIGTRAVVFGLVISAAPFVARLVEQSLLEVDAGVVEAAESMGASVGQIVRKVLLPEAWPSLLNGLLVAMVTIVGYSAMAGFVGGGGLGDLAVKYGLYRYDYAIMMITLALLILLVQIVQSVGMRLVRRTDKRINE